MTNDKGGAKMYKNNPGKHTANAETNRKIIMMEAMWAHCIHENDNEHQRDQKTSQNYGNSKKTCDL